MVAKPSPLVVIVGETASGKSDLALDLALRFNGEIINADSWSVYKGFDIGTAKPSREDRELIRHHLFDIADPLTGFNAAAFKRLAVGQINSTSRSGKLPFLVGGTGLYIDSVLYNYSFLPDEGPNLRPVYNAMGLSELAETARQHGYDLDGIDLNNKRRVIRLLENKGIRPTAGSLRKNTIVIGKKIDRTELEANIAKRVDRMLSAGLEAEVKNLSAMYGWDIEPMKGIGYREFKDYFNGSKELAAVRQSIISNSLGLAKKQRTWFKRNKSIQWFDNTGSIVEILTTFLNNLDAI